jgi:hypothetical protein
VQEPADRLRIGNAGAAHAVVALLSHTPSVRPAP